MGNITCGECALEHQTNCGLQNTMRREHLSWTVAVGSSQKQAEFWMQAWSIARCVTYPLQMTVWLLQVLVPSKLYPARQVQWCGRWGGKWMEGLSVLGTCSRQYQVLLVADPGNKRTLVLHPGHGSVLQTIRMPQEVGYPCNLRWSNNHLALESYKTLYNYFCFDGLLSFFSLHAKQ